MGSAVQRSFLKINDAVLEGGDTLASFAETAGMSSKDFKKAWQDDAAQALIPFLKGLNDTHEAGGNVNGILKDLGISSVNELNTLLVLAGGYDQLAGNLELASNAYNETEESMMALNKEAELAYGTTLGKLRTAWNRLKDSLIDIGEPIADAVLDMVDAAEPLFKVVEDLATGFSNLDETAQRDIISTVAKIALIAPALKIAGGMMTTTGDIFKVGAGVTRKAGEIMTKAMFGVTGEVEVLTAVAGTATGSKGVGGLVGVLSGAGAGALPWALGIAAVALGGWTLWKVWGEDAWEAAEQTRKWGTVVGEETEGVLGDIENTLGTFNLLQQGVSADTALMVGDFQKMGQSIEDDINRRLELTEEYLGGLPETLRNSVEEMLGDYQENLQETQAIIQKNNDEIAQIQQKASDENRKLNAYELAYINELQRYSMDEYIGILDITAAEEKAIRSALSGDIENISKEQTLNLIALLNDERTAINTQHQETLQETEAYLKERNLLNTKAGDEILAKVDSYYEAMRVNGDRTMQELFNLYPELEKTHDLATGNILSTNEQARKKQLASNALLVESWTDSHKDMEKTSKEFADAQSMIVDSTRAGAETWNKIVVDSGGNVEKFREGILEASKTAEGWNHIRFQIHEANLDSNARLIIAEAAIQNGYWNGMAWEDKQALLKDNFSETVYQAIVDEGTWDKLSWEEKFAVLNNGFSDGVVQAIIDEGKWEKLPWEQKKAVLTTNSPETLKQILKDIGIWNTLPIAVKDLLADKTQLDRTVENAQKKLNSLKDKSVTITTRNQTIYESIYRAQGNKASSNWVQSGGSILHARGTDYHPGGMAMVNDQQGATFRELVTLPDGSSFVPKGRNVMLDLPKGSKVLRAALTKMKFPDIKQYKDGVGYSRQQTQQIMANNNTDMSQTNSLLTTLIDMVRNGQVIQMDGNEVGKTIYPRIDSTMSNNMQRSQVMNIYKGG